MFQNMTSFAGPNEPTVKFWRGNGSYWYAVNVPNIKGRKTYGWHWVGEGKAGLDMLQTYEKAGFKLHRVQGMPRIIENLWRNTRGNPIEAIKAALPQWTQESDPRLSKR